MLFPPAVLPARRIVSQQENFTVPALPARGFSHLCNGRQKIPEPWTEDIQAK
jgi:hypothetical protein